MVRMECKFTIVKVVGV